MAIGKAKFTGSTRRRQEHLVRIHVVVPQTLSTAVRELAAARRQSLAALHTEALRIYIDKQAGRDDQESSVSLVIRQLIRMSRKQELLLELNRIILETQGAQLKLELGSFKHPKTPEEKRQFEEQAAQRWPGLMAMIAAGLTTRNGEFLSQFARTSIAKEENFPEPDRGMKGSADSYPGHADAQ